MYQRLNDTTNILRWNDNESMTSFALDPANTDYQQFKLDITNGAELQDADGNVMSEAQVQAFVSSLP